MLALELMACFLIAFQEEHRSLRNRLEVQGEFSRQFRHQPYSRINAEVDKAMKFDGFVLPVLSFV